MKKIFIVIWVLIFGILGWAEKVTTLTEVLKPTVIQVDDSQFYIVEGATIFIYSLKDYKLIKKFGKEGQGPGEFATNPQLPTIIDVSTDEIIVNSIGKLSYFTKDGNFKKEIKTVSPSFNFQPMGDRFIGMGRVQDDKKLYNTVNIFDSKLAKIKEIYRADTGLRGPGKGIEAIQKVFWFQYYDNKIFLPGQTDDEIDVFDKDMNKLFTIKVEAKKIKISDEFKKEVINQFKTTPGTKEIFDAFLKPVRFSEYFPTILFFFCADDILYVMTWNRENEKNEFYTYDMKGKLIKKLWIPLAYQDYLQPFPLSIKNGKLYQVVENIDTEEWELHISEIK